MLSEYYKKHPYFFNLLIVLILLTTVRIVDWIVWTPPAPGVISQIILAHLFEFVAGLPLLSLLLFSYHWALKKKSKILIISLVFLFSFLGPTILKIITLFLEQIFRLRETFTITFDLIEKITPFGIVYFLSLSATFYITYSRLQFIRQKNATHKAETLAKDAQLKMLNYQINPHFLFNTLNCLHALVDEDKGKAKELIVSMSEYYRYTLNKNQQKTSIANEVKTIKKYLEIQKTRFEEKLEYEIMLDDILNSIHIPSFIISLLIENAIQYGIKSNEQKLSIRLLIKMLNNTLVISVSNTGKIIFPNPANDQNIYRNGNGLDNIKGRLSFFYADHYSFTVNEANGWVEATIKIENIMA